ncbi:MAG: hypothetical protein COB85_08845 [Bacteroidetes bacterium]|nr:MAG: hypothetical protein COB85_08845 [Bacteroidota bacterium]
MRIAYILGSFPSISEIFILNEIVLLKKKDIHIQIISINKSDTVLENDICNLQVNTIYPPTFFSFIILKTNLLYLLKRPRVYFKTIVQSINSYPVLPFQLLKNLRNFFNGVYFTYQLRDQDIEHIHAHFASQPTCIAMIISELSEIAFSFTAHAHDIYTDKKGELSVKINRAKFVITCTAYNKEFLGRLAHQSTAKIYHIYHGLDVSTWPFRIPHITKNPVQILTVARLVKKKGITYLLKALKILLDKGYSVQCTIIGKGPLSRDLVQQSINANISENVKFINALSPREIKHYYFEADVFILPSTVAEDGDMDGLPNVLMEALATGVPVISTTISAIPELVEHEQTGLLVPEKNVEAIVDTFLKLMANYELFSSIAINGRKKMVEEFDIEKSTEKLKNIFHSHI